MADSGVGEKSPAELVFEHISEKLLNEITLETIILSVEELEKLIAGTASALPAGSPVRAVLLDNLRSYAVLLRKRCLQKMDSLQVRSEQDGDMMKRKRIKSMAEAATPPFNLFDPENVEFNAGYVKVPRSGEPYGVDHPLPDEHTRKLLQTGHSKIWLSYIEVHNNDGDMDGKLVERAAESRCSTEVIGAILAPVAANILKAAEDGCLKKAHVDRLDYLRCSMTKMQHTEQYFSSFVKPLAALICLSLFKPKLCAAKRDFSDAQTVYMARALSKLDYFIFEEENLEPNKEILIVRAAMALVPPSRKMKKPSVYYRVAYNALQGLDPNAYAYVLRVYISRRLFQIDPPEGSFTYDQARLQLQDSVKTPPSEAVFSELLKISSTIGLSITRSAYPKPGLAHAALLDEDTIPFDHLYNVAQAVVARYCGVEGAKEELLKAPQEDEEADSLFTIDTGEDIDFSYMFENFEKDLLIDDGDEDKIPDEFPFEEMDFSKFTGKEDMSKYC